MIRAVWFLVLILAVALVAVLIADNPGTVALDWLGYRVETSIGILLTLFLAASISLAVVFRVWSLFRTSPRRIIRSRREWRRRRGYKALTQGMVAVAAGDAQEARRLAKRAENLLAEPPLTMLLSAQAAQLSGDEKAAGQFFEAMAEKPETEYLGLHGMLNQAVQEGDKEGALELAEKANELKPKTDTVSETLFDLQIKNANWQDAEDTVKKAVRNKHTDSETGRRRRAVLLYQRSVEAESEGKLSDALGHAKRANNLAPSFVPAAVRNAQLLANAGKRRKASSVIEEIWVSNPHPHLVTVMENLTPGASSEENMHTLERLANYNRDDMESHVAVASAALIAGRWREAREHLDAAIKNLEDDSPPARICRMMAELEEAENEDVEKSREWLKQASVADPDSAYVCSNCGNVVAEWELVCERCEQFDTLEWKTPPRITRLHGPTMINKNGDAGKDETDAIDIAPDISGDKTPDISPGDASDSDPKQEP